MANKMSHDAIVSYLDIKIQDNERPSQALAERLSDALKKYQFDSEIEKLNIAYSGHLDREKLLKSSRLNSRALAKAFGTFNIAPSGSYKHYMSTLANKSDLEAIHSDWKMVGEDLSFAVIKNLIESRESNE